MNFTTLYHKKHQNWINPWSWTITT